MAFAKSALILVAAVLPLGHPGLTLDAPPQSRLETPPEWT